MLKLCLLRCRHYFRIVCWGYVKSLHVSPPQLISLPFHLLLGIHDSGPWARGLGTWCVCIYIYNCIYLYIHKYISIYTYTYICTHSHVHAIVCVCAYIYVCLRLGRCSLGLCVLRWRFNLKRHVYTEREGYIISARGPLTGLLSSVRPAIGK